MRENEILVDEEQLAQFIYKHLTEKGYAVTEEEAEEIADSVFEYLISEGMECEDADS